MTYVHPQALPHRGLFLYCNMWSSVNVRPLWGFLDGLPWSVSCHYGNVLVVHMWRWAWFFEEAVSGLLYLQTL